MEKTSLSEILNSILENPTLLYSIIGSILVLISLFIFLLLLKRRKKPKEHKKNTPSEAPVSAKTTDNKEELNLVDQATWLVKLQNGLHKTRDILSTNIKNVFQKNPLKDEFLDSLHEALYRSDINVKAVDRLVDFLKKELKENPIDKVEWEDVKSLLSKEMERILDLPTTPSTAQPTVVLVIGVNGVGKTTTIGKLAAHFQSENKKVLLAAADTYRAAAIDQLKIWGDRMDIKVIAHKEGSDPAAVVFDAMKAAKSRETDVLLIDTAGRLHNKKHLMDELGKISRIIKKEIPEAPHETLLVLDATTGQNAFMQVRAFNELIKITGICLTKLDGTAKGGVTLGLAEEFKIPIRYIGVGEKASDLRKFEAKDFVDSLLS